VSSWLPRDGAGPPGWLGNPTPEVIWLSVVALPAVVADDADDAMREDVWSHDVTAKGDRWRRAAA
jgi:hypothetical protein